MDLEVRSGFSNHLDANRAVDEVWEQMGGESASLVVMFASCKMNQERLNRAWAARLPEGVPLVGCTSLHVNLPFLRMRKNLSNRGTHDGLVAIRFASPAIRAAVEAVSDVTTDGPTRVVAALHRLAERLEVDLASDEMQRMFGLLLCDGPSGRADAVLEELYLAAPRLRVLGGGSAGALQLTSGKLAPGYVHTAAASHRGGAALALVRSDIPFRVEMVTSYEPTSTQFRITRAEGQKLYELDGRSAAAVYASTLGVSQWKLGNPRIPNSRLLLRNPLGLVIDGKPYLRSVAFREGDALEVAVGELRAGQSFRLMRPGDLVSTTREMLARIRADLGAIAGALVFSCAYRALEADVSGVSESMAEILGGAPMAGLLSYGEYFQGLAVSQTLTTVAFAASPQP